MKAVIYKTGFLWFITFFFLTFISYRLHAQATFKELMTFIDQASATYQGKPQIVGTWTDTLTKKGFLVNRLEWKTQMPGGIEYSDIFSFADMKDDGIDERLEVIVNAVSENERPRGVALSLSTDDLNQHVSWSADIRKSARYRMKIKTSSSELFRTDIENNTWYDPTTY